MTVLSLLFPGGDISPKREHSHEIFNNLRVQIPFVYIVSIVNLVSVHLATGLAEVTMYSPVTLLTGLLLWRATYWAFFCEPTDNLAVAQRALLRVAVFTFVLGLGFSVWVQVLMTRYPDLVLSISIFTSLVALGAGYGLSSFPRVALVPLVVLAFPVSVRLLLWDDIITNAMGISLLSAVLLFMHLLRTHSLALAKLLDSRAVVSQEHNRAISAEAAAIKRADEDGLTGLPNRSRLIREIEAHMVCGTASGGGSVVAICDLDGFKRANDVFGHAAGDALLKAFGERLAKAFEGHAIVARMGGDEFAVFWRDGLAEECIKKVGDQICELARHPVGWMGKHLTVATSCGFAEAGPRCASVKEFLRQADTALYMAKASGRGQWRSYDENAHVMDMRRAKLEALLFNQAAIDFLEVAYQTIYSVQDKHVVFIEALARWNDVELGLIQPQEFIPLAESLGRIDAVNDAILKQALVQIAGWRCDIRLSFNLSAAQISRRGAADHLLGILEHFGVSPNRLLFEVRESAVLADLSIAKAELANLRRAGCMTALDDFGASHASVSYLRDFEFDVVKLDGTLSENIHHCARSRQILLGMVSLCHAAGALCVAEHVESKEQLALIKAMGCDMVQGFLLSRPVEAGHLDNVNAEWVHSSGDLLLRMTASTGKPSENQFGIKLSGDRGLA